MSYLLLAKKPISLTKKVDMVVRVLLFSFLLTAYCSAQDSLKEKAATPEMIASFKKNQHQLDLNHGGIGFMFYRPGLGNLVTYDKPWVGIDIVSDILQVKLGVGTNKVQGTIPFGFTGTEYINTREFGYQFSVGVNAPMNFLTIGAQHSSSSVFRGHPTLSAELGYFNMTNESSYASKNTSQLYYLGFNPGYRFRLPYCSIEANLNTRLGLGVGTNSDYYKGVGIYPSITFRFDALKWAYNPNLISVPASQTSVSNVQSTTYNTGTRYNSDGSRVEYYTTYTTADVSVSNFNVGVQDIGPHVGIGPKFSFMSPKKSPYIPTENLYGLVLEGRGGAFDFGVTLEGGKVGHGSELKVKDEEEGKYYKKLSKNETDGQGTLNVANLYMNIGMDITSLFLVPLGIAIDKGEATSFFGVTAGFLVGGHLAFNQTYLNPAIQSKYDALLIADNGRAKEKFIDPSKSNAGYLGGVYISVQVGAMSFKITNYRYHGAPFASTSMFGIAYRFPKNTFTRSKR